MCCARLQGQALAALGQVSTLEVVSRAAGAFDTYRKCVSGGTEVACGPCRAPRARHGTGVKVANFGFAQPVRQQSMLTEAASGVLAERVKRRLVALLLPFPAVELTLLVQLAGSDAASGRKQQQPAMHLAQVRQVHLATAL